MQPLSDGARSAIGTLDGENPQENFWRGWRKLFSPEKLAVANMILLIDELGWDAPSWLFAPMADYLVKYDPESIHVSLLSKATSADSKDS